MTDYWTVIPCHDAVREGDCVYEGVFLSGIGYPGENSRVYDHVWRQATETEVIVARLEGKFNVGLPKWMTKIAASE